MFVSNFHNILNYSKILSFIFKFPFITYSTASAYPYICKSMCLRTFTHISFLNPKERKWCFTLFLCEFCNNKRRKKRKLRTIIIINSSIAIVVPVGTAYPWKYAAYDGKSERHFVLYLNKFHLKWFTVTILLGYWRMSLYGLHDLRHFSKFIVFSETEISKNSKINIRFSLHNLFWIS